MNRITHPFSLPFLFILLFTACPENSDEPLECGDHQILVDGECRCEDGYHWNDDCTECLLDTTSHNFVWTIDTLGIKGSYLKDVWIEAEDDIWVVGNIRVDDPDSSFNGTGWKEYNAAHWDGYDWELSGFYNTVGDLYSIFFFNVNDIWVTSYCSPIHWDGEQWTLYHLENMGLDACAGLDIWGTSSDNMYFVGIEGSVVHYDGSAFTRLNTPNSAKLFSISGSADGEYIFAAGYDIMHPTNTTALMIHGGDIEELYYSDELTSQSSTDYGLISSVSVLGDTAYFVTYLGMWKYNYITRESVVSKGIGEYGYRSLHENNRNDMFMVGGGFDYVHYNGVTWDYNTILLDEYDFSSTSGIIKGNTAIIVGHIQDLSNAIIAIGRR